MPRSPLFDRPRLLDGAMGTELIRSGLALGEPGERWLLEAPERILAVHRAYAGAGAEVLTTATFGATRLHLIRNGLAERTAELNHRAVELAREAAGADGLVAGNLGPLLRDPDAPVPPGTVQAAFGEQGALLAESGVDLLLVETMTDALEAELVVAALSGLAPPIAVTFAVRFDDGGTVRLLGGAPLTESVAAVERAGASAVGLNCMSTASELLPALVALRRATALPIVAQPNAGQPRPRPTGGFDYDEAPALFARGLAELRAAGAVWVGGCCGTTPAHIAAAAHFQGESPDC